MGFEYSPLGSQHFKLLYFKLQYITVMYCDSKKIKQTLIGYSAQYIKLYLFRKLESQQVYLAQKYTWCWSHTYIQTFNNNEDILTIFQIDFQFFGWNVRISWQIVDVSLTLIEIIWTRYYVFPNIIDNSYGFICLMLNIFHHISWRNCISLKAIA